MVDLIGFLPSRIKISHKIKNNSRKIFVKLKKNFIYINKLMYKQVLYNFTSLMYRVMYSECLGILIHMNWQKKGYS
jgi:hypothetical protein